MSLAGLAGFLRPSLWLYHVPGLDERRCVACSVPFSRASARVKPFLPLCAECRSLLAPRRKGYCPLCGEIAENPETELALCPACKKETPPWRCMRFVGEYNGLLRTLLHRAKYAGDAATLALLGHMLAQVAWDMPAVDALVPLPLHFSRLQQRGFNQCVEIAKSMVKILPAYATQNTKNGDAHGLVICEKVPPICLDFLIKKRPTPSQTTLSRKERLANLQNVFEASPKVQGKHLLLLDDTSTTGASLREAARTLLAAGAASVDALFVAHANAFAPSGIPAQPARPARLVQGSGESTHHLAFTHRGNGA